MQKIVGVLALQGAFIEHIKILQKLGVATQEIRLPQDLSNIQGLIIPGGESTTMSNLLVNSELFTPIKAKVQQGMAIWGTCAGAILLAKKVANFSWPTLQLMDMQVTRNAFGRQIASFEENIHCSVLGKKPFPAIFIRAPIIEHVGQEVKILSSLADKTIIAVQQAKCLATVFHPELTNDSRWHEYFLSLV